MKVRIVFQSGWYKEVEMTELEFNIAIDKIQDGVKWIEIDGKHYNALNINVIERV